LEERAEEEGAGYVYAKWSDIREEHIDRIGKDEFDAGKEEMLAEVRGWRTGRDQASLRLHAGSGGGSDGSGQRAT
jgi:hypothetical protein